jgi:hypothetical protein
MNCTNKNSLQIKDSLKSLDDLKKYYIDINKKIKFIYDTPPYIQKLITILSNTPQEVDPLGNIPLTKQENTIINTAAHKSVQQAAADTINALSNNEFEQQRALLEKKVAENISLAVNSFKIFTDSIKTSANSISLQAKAKIEATKAVEAARRVAAEAEARRAAEAEEAAAEEARRAAEEAEAARRAEEAEAARKSRRS